MITSERSKSGLDLKKSDLDCSSTKMPRAGASPGVEASEGSLSAMASGVRLSRARRCLSLSQSLTASSFAFSAGSWIRG